MNIGSLCHMMMSVPVFLMPGLFHQSGQQPTQMQPSNMRQERQMPGGMPGINQQNMRSGMPTRPNMPTHLGSIPNQAMTPAPAGTPAPTPTATPQTKATTEIASEQTCPGQSDVANTVAALTCLTNNARVYNGLAPVQANAQLLAAADAKNQDQLKCGYGHTACGKTFDYWMKAKGYTGKCTGENIAYGQKSPREVFTAWMNSEGHRANILNKDYRDLGVSEVASSNGPLWVMELGGC